MKKTKEIIIVTFIIVVLSGITLSAMAGCTKPVISNECGPDDCGPNDDLTGC